MLGLSEDSVKVSVLILTADRLDLLTRCLNRMSHSVRPPDEIIVVDNGCHSASDVVRTAAVPIRALYFRVENKGFGWLRQYGISQASGDIVAMVDDDCLVAPDWCGKILERFQSNSGIGLVAGNIHSSGFSEQRAIGRGSWLGPNGCLRPLPSEVSQDRAAGYGGSNTSLRRGAAQAVGGFDPNLNAAFEDIDIAVRLRAAGFRIEYAEEARVEHMYHPIRKRSFWRNAQVSRLHFYVKLFALASPHDFWPFLRTEWGVLRRQLRNTVGGASRGIVSQERASHFLGRVQHEDVYGGYFSARSILGRWQQRSAGLIRRGFSLAGYVLVLSAYHLIARLMLPFIVVRALRRRRAECLDANMDYSRLTELAIFSTH